MTRWRPCAAFEDEPAVRSFVVALLRQHGFEVLAASGGSEALELFRASAAPVELLLSDMIMPGMTGPELAQTLRATHPRLAVVFMSGYPGETIETLGRESGGAPLIGKPFGADELLRVLRSQLERMRASSDADSLLPPLPPA